MSPWAVPRLQGPGRGLLRSSLCLPHPDKPGPPQRLRLRLGMGSGVPLDTVLTCVTRNERLLPEPPRSPRGRSRPHHRVPRCTQQGEGGVPAPCPSTVPRVTAPGSDATPSAQGRGPGRSWVLAARPPPQGVGPLHGAPRAERGAATHSAETARPPSVTHGPTANSQGLRRPRLHPSHLRGQAHVAAGPTPNSTAPCQQSNP